MIHAIIYNEGTNSVVKVINKHFHEKNIHIQIKKPGTGGAIALAMENQATSMETEYEVVDLIDGNHTKSLKNYGLAAYSGSDIPGQPLCIIYSI